MADHLEALLDESGWTEPVSIAGSSFGGVIGLELAARGRAKNVVALAPPWLGVKSGIAYTVAFGAMQVWLRLSDAYLPRSTRWAPVSGLALHGSMRPALMDSDDLVDTLRSFARFPLWRVVLERRRPEGMLPEFGL